MAKPAHCRRRQRADERGYRVVVGGQEIPRRFDPARYDADSVLDAAERWVDSLPVPYRRMRGIYGAAVDAAVPTEVVAREYTRRLRGEPWTDPYAIRDDVEDE